MSHHMAMNTVMAHIGSPDDMGARFVAAWHGLERGDDVARDHVTFLSLADFTAAMSPRRVELLRHLRRAGPMSVRRLSSELKRDYKSVHREVALLSDAGLIDRRARDEVTVDWDRAVTALDLAA
jgi:predicted transcriptional regulator